MTVLNRVGQVAAVQTNSTRPFLGREGNCQLCSPLSSAQHGPGQSGSIWQSSLLEVELYHIQVEPQERRVALGLSQIAALFLKATGFAPFWEAALSPLLQTWYWKSLGALQPPAHPSPPARPLNETFTQQDNLAGAKYFSPFLSKLFPNLTAELEAPCSALSSERRKSEIAIASTC